MRQACAPAALTAVSMAFGGCGDLEGFGAAMPPLVTFQLQVTGALPPVRPPGVDGERSLQVALVWGAQGLTEPFCVLPPESDAAAAVIAAGCRDPFGFVPERVAASVPIASGAPASLSLYDLPAADVMVGAVTARVAYGSFVVYDDRDGNGTLDLAYPHRTPGGGRRAGAPPVIDVEDSSDIVYGASFVTMTAPDRRVAFREGTFDDTAAFYPRSGCSAPPPGFSVMGAGGFAASAGLASVISGVLPPEDPATCTAAPPDAGALTIAVQAPADVREVSCGERSDDSSARYREPPSAAPDFTDRVTACARLPSFEARQVGAGAGAGAGGAGGQPKLVQLVVSGRPQDRCKGLTHYTLRGCREDASCLVADWDLTGRPPAWWPCPTGVAS